MKGLLETAGAATCPNGVTTDFAGANTPKPAPLQKKMLSVKRGALDFPVY